MSTFPSVVASHPVMTVCYFKKDGTTDLLRGQPVWRTGGIYRNSHFEITNNGAGKTKENFVGIAQTSQPKDGVVTVGIAGVFNVILGGYESSKTTLRLLHQETPTQSDRRYLIATRN